MARKGFIWLARATMLFFLLGLLLQTAPLSVHSQVSDVTASSLRPESKTGPVPPILPQAPDAPVYLLWLTPPAGEPPVGMEAQLLPGFYLSQELLDRFNTKFYELKLSGVAIENKSGLLERALEFALDDLDKGDRSAMLDRIKR